MNNTLTSDKQSHILSALSPKEISINSESSKLKKFSVKNIDSVKTRSQEHLVFSFELFDRLHHAFNLGEVCVEWYVQLFDILKDMCNHTWSQISTQKRSFYDPHKHNWNKVNHPFDFDEETLNQHEGMQFRLGKGNGRVHGFLVGNTFYIYWLDRYHNMNDSEGYGGEDIYPPVKSCFEVMNDSILELKKERDHAVRKLEEAKKNMNIDAFNLLEDLIKLEAENKTLKSKVEYLSQISEGMN